MKSIEIYLFDRVVHFRIVNFFLRITAVELVYPDAEWLVCSAFWPRTQLGPYALDRKRLIAAGGLGFQRVWPRE